MTTEESIVDSFSELRRLYESKGDAFTIARKKKGVLFLKIRSLMKEHLFELLKKQEIEVKDKKVWSLRETLFLSEISEEMIDKFIRKKYKMQINVEQEYKIRCELQKLKNYQSSVWMGNLDSMLQRSVRRIKNFNELEKEIEEKHLPMVRNYVLWSWYNQWTERIIGNIFSEHEEVIPTLRKVRAVDFFIKNTPFDLKVSFLPKGFIKDLEKEMGTSFNDNTEIIKFAIKDPKKLAKWLYENQGPIRFDNSSRLFLILINVKEIDNSWKLKSEFDLISKGIEDFLDSEHKYYHIDYYYDKSDLHRGNYSTICYVLFILSNDVNIS